MDTKIQIEEARHWEREVNNLVKETEELLKKIEKTIEDETLDDKIHDTLRKQSEAINASFTKLNNSFKEAMNALNKAIKVMENALNKIVETGEKMISGLTH